MDDKILALLTQQIQDISINKPLKKSDMLFNASEEIKNLQKSIYRLSNCLLESNNFLHELSGGNLDAQLPSRYNFISGYLKELHSIMIHISWQAEQVANGDYSQRIRFMGKLSKSFNIMVEQLQEREIALEEKSNALAQSMDLLIAIMETQSNSIAVIDVESRDIIYKNKPANNDLHKIISKGKDHNPGCSLLEEIKQVINISSIYENEYYCVDETYIRVTSYPIEWNTKKAIVHYITDITEEKESKENLSALAYTDELTGIYNRRYCKESINELLENKDSFSFVMFDVDKLKKVNDEFGHATGDEYINCVTKTVRNSIREDDIFCRVGGDEFVIAFKNCDEKFADIKMNKIRNDLMHMKKEYFLSISYGIVFVGKETLLNVDEIFKLSDIKMYEYKNKYNSINN